MRLDHLLSTESFRARFLCPVCATRMPAVGVVGVDAGVEEIGGLLFPWGWREWYGCAFGFPDRHPAVVSIVARFRCPCGVAGVRWTRGGTRGAWRFENWIVDASKRKRFRFLFAYRDFAKLFFLSLVSRSIVL